MTDSSPAWRTRSHTFLVVLGTSILVLATSVAGASASSESPAALPPPGASTPPGVTAVSEGLVLDPVPLSNHECPTGWGCVWSGEFFTGAKARFPAQEGRYSIGYWFRSAKNRYGDRRFWAYSTYYNAYTRCLGPGQNADSFRPSDWVRVDGEGTRCP